MGGSGPEPRYKHCAITSDKKLIIIGGINQNARLGNIFEYSTESRQWGILPINQNRAGYKGRYGHSCCLVDNGKNIIIFGGSDEEKRNDVIRYELATGNFYKVQQFEEEAPSPRDFHSSTMISHDIMAIIGGTDSTIGKINEVYKFRYDCSSIPPSTLVEDFVRKLIFVNF